MIIHYHIQMFSLNFSFGFEKSHCQTIFHVSYISRWETYVVYCTCLLNLENFKVCNPDFLSSRQCNVRFMFSKFIVNTSSGLTFQYHTTNSLQKHLSYTMGWLQAMHKMLSEKTGTLHFLIILCSFDSQILYF